MECNTCVHTLNDLFHLMTNHTFFFHIAMRIHWYRVKRTQIVIGVCPWYVSIKTASWQSSQLRFTRSHFMAFSFADLYGAGYCRTRLFPSAFVCSLHLTFVRAFSWSYSVKICNHSRIPQMPFTGPYFSLSRTYTMQICLETQKSKQNDQWWKWMKQRERFTQFVQIYDTIKYRGSRNSHARNRSSNRFYEFLRFLAFWHHQFTFSTLQFGHVHLFSTIVHNNYYYHYSYIIVTIIIISCRSSNIMNFDVWTAWNSTLICDFLPN